MKKSELLEGFSIEELQERDEFSIILAAPGCCSCFDPTPCCCFGGPCC
jgi:hypothetical protein